MNSQNQNKYIANNIMNELDMINNLPYSKALKYIERKIWELRSTRTSANTKRISESVKVLIQKRKEINKSINKIEKDKYKTGILFDENKQLKLQLKALQKEFKEKTEKIKRMKIAQLITYKKERDQAIKFSNENKKQLQKKIKENDLYRKRQEIKETRREEKKQKFEQQKETAAAKIQKWYKKENESKQRYSVKVILYKCWDLKTDLEGLCVKTDYSERIDKLNKRYNVKDKKLTTEEQLKYDMEYEEIVQSSLKKVEEIYKRKHFKFFYKHIADYSHGSQNVEIKKFMYAHRYAPAHISIKMKRSDFDKYHEHYTYKENVLKD